MAVPTGQLKQDEKVVPSVKATPEQMRAYMSPVPVVYDRIRAGARTEDFQRMRISDDPSTRDVGAAYHYLFSPDGRDHRIEAEIVEGKGLVVTRGRHRVEAAREIGLPYIPVHVRAADERTLESATRNFEDQLQLVAPDAVRVQQQLDNEHREARLVKVERTRVPPTANTNLNDRASRAMESSPFPSRTGPSRGRDHS